MTRIISAQGSMPLLNVLSVLEHQRRIGEITYLSQDILLIGGLYTRDEKAARKTALFCEQMARVWPFKKIVFLQPLETLISEGSITFEQGVERLRSELGINECDCSYVGRNWQLFNELVLNAFPSKQVIATGDFLGYLDIDEPQFGRIHSLQGLKPVNFAYLVTPIEGTQGAFRRCEVRQVDPFDFATVVAKVATQIEGFQNFCTALNSKMPDPCALLITAYDTDATLSRSLEDEVSSYCELVRKEVRPGSAILVKGHPRQASQQAEELVRRLKAMGYRVFSLTDYNQVPVEIFSSFFLIENIIACNSYAAVSLAYLNQCPVTSSFGETLLRKTMRPEWQRDAFEGERIRVIAIRQAYSQKFSPIYFDEWKHSDALPAPEPMHFSRGNDSGVTPIQRAKELIATSAFSLGKMRGLNQQRIVDVPSPLNFRLTRGRSRFSRIFRRLGNIFSRVRQQKIPKG